MVFAVLDLETTGLHPEQGDRVCEVAVVRMRGDGTVLDEYSTLVAPGVPLRNAEFHQITEAQIARAPSFADIAGDLIAYLSDAVVVAHNLPFEEGFLRAEFGALNIRAWGLPGLCTLHTLRTQLDRHGYKQSRLYQLMTGEWMRGQHHALADARHLARMLSLLLNESPAPLSWVGPGPTAAPPLPRSGRIAPRTFGLRRGQEGWLANLAAGLPNTNPSPRPHPQGMAAYRSMLGHALEDGRIVGEEAHRLAELATAAGLTQTTIGQVHEQVLVEARVRAEADGVVTSVELRELERAAHNLGTGHAIKDLLYVAEQERARKKGPLKGWRVVPIGESPAMSAVMDYAVAQGATAGVNVTKTTRLVIAEAGETDPKVERALQNGHRVLPPAQAWDALRAASDRREAGLFADGGSAQIASGAGARPTESEEQAPWQSFWRPEELGEGEYHRRFVAPFAERDRATAPVAATESKGGCAGVLLLFTAIGGALTGGVGGLWPF
ncbi:MAG TPA: 3'-5' exonuclease [Nocardiopsis listeri]|uniref:3'-5' exonuclease n=1 Tax=Nocardiopsis listeri TaxID=53440 RepID=UPI001DF7AC20|nr:3'-5' exonuclease [Nocardiopsis listeri]HJE57485.1 3'-5' exonuclease [Nocardiopsis listeri]